MKTLAKKTGRKTLETIIKDALAVYPESARFKVIAFELWRDDVGWSVNDSWCIAGDADKTDVIRAARGRWEAFKVNYAPRARVADIVDIGYEADRISLEVDCTAFLDIELVSE